MKALAEKSSSKDTLTRNRQGTNHNHALIEKSVSASPGSILLIQRKSLCPCDGGCPRCTGIIQSKLFIGQPDDKYEQEADRVADMVMRMPEPEGSLVNGHWLLGESEKESPLIQCESISPECMEEDDEVIQTKPLADQITPIIQRQVEPEEEDEEEEFLQPKANSHQIPGETPNLESRVQSLRSVGYPLSESTRVFFESRFGRDLSNVRVHTDSTAVSLSKSLRARAFTAGEHVGFDKGEYQPGTLLGDTLIAHEMVHVIQQGKANSSIAHKHKEGMKSNPEPGADKPSMGTGSFMRSGVKETPAHITKNVVPRLRPGLKLQLEQRRQQEVREVTIPPDIMQIRNNIFAILNTLSLGSAIRDELEVQLDLLWSSYQNDLEHASSSSDQERIHERYRRRLRRMRTSFPLQIQLTQEFGILFTSQMGYYWNSARSDRIRSFLRNRQLRRFICPCNPRGRQVSRFCRRIRTDCIAKIELRRTPRSVQGQTVRAGFERSTHTLVIHPSLFNLDAREIPRSFVHEIGHSTYETPAPGSTGGFSSLPPEGWMRAGEWNRSTNLLRDLRISRCRAENKIAEMNKEERGQFPFPVRIGNWLVVYDKFESGYTPTRFFYYPRSFNDYFVSEYAKSHPGDDLAESFAFCIERPQEYLLQSEPEVILSRHGGRKLRYLRQRYGRRFCRPPGWRPPSRRRRSRRRTPGRSRR